MNDEKRPDVIGLVTVLAINNFGLNRLRRYVDFYPKKDVNDVIKTQYLNPTKELKIVQI